jgi:hypothetical protein
MSNDLLLLDKINSLPHPLFGKFLGGWCWPIFDIDVQTGLLRIDVCGKLQVSGVGELTCLVDANMTEHPIEQFYNEEE